MIAFHVTPSPVVIVDEFRNDVIQVAFAEEDEFEKALVLDRLNESLDPAVCTRCRLHLIATLRRERFGSRIRFTRCMGENFCW